MLHPLESVIRMAAPTVYTTSTGVRLRIRPVPSLAVMAASRALPVPQIPTFHNEQKNRDEPNPVDPTYLQALEERKVREGEVTTDAYLANGLTVLEPLPDDVEPAQSEVWAEGIELLGVAVPANGFARRVAWLKYYVLSDDDLMEIMKLIAVAGGVVTEQQVTDAVDSFRSDTGGPSDLDVPTLITDRRGD